MPDAIQRDAIQRYVHTTLEGMKKESEDDTLQQAGRMLREHMRSNVARYPFARGFPLRPCDAAEQRARRTLRDLLTEAEWRRYAVHGFVVTQGASGLRYQVYRNHRMHVKIYRHGKAAYVACLHTNISPPTDHVLNIMSLIALDEAAFWRSANVSPVEEGFDQHTFEHYRIEAQSLPEHYRFLKKALRVS